LVGFAIAAIFGKLEWKKVAILAVGLALLAVASQVVNYAIDSEAGGSIDSGRFEEELTD
jgi:type IV secretory pathway VirB2 component (pilin)